MTNLDKYKNDLDTLIGLGDKLHMAMQFETYPENFRKAIAESFGKKAPAYLKALPSFRDSYQSWYSESKSLIKLLLPDRLEDFVRHYERPSARKDITYESYRIEDYLQDLHVTRGWEKQKIVGPSAAIPRFRQQLAILKSAQSRFVSTLYDIKQLVQADLFDSELDAAQELLNNKFTRAAGAVAGVVLERHLAQVCENHNIVISKKCPAISDFNDALKQSAVLDISQWRFNQHLADIRNLCDHAKTLDPKPEQVQNLIDGVKKVTKSLF